MARDIHTMEDENVGRCPHCGCELLLEWQLAIYDGYDAPQFIGLKEKTTTKGTQNGKER